MRRSRGLGIGVIVVAAMLCGASVADAAATYSAAPGTTDAVATACTAAGSGAFTCANLRSAVTAAEAVAGSTVRLSTGTYTLTTGQLTVAPVGALTIEGSGASQTIIRQTNAASRVVAIQSGTVELTELELTGGTATTTGGCLSGASGGGIVNAAPLTLDHVSVTGNNADGIQGASASTGTAGSGGEANGGGICTTGPLTLTDSTVSDNTARGGLGGTGTSSAKGGPGGSAAGGGIDSPAPLILNGTAVSSNHAIAGAGGHATGSGNGGSADGAEGGGIVDVGSNAPTITDAVFNANTVAGGTGGDAAAGNGGDGGSAFGSAFDGVPGTISDSAISGGTATGGKGGAAAGAGDTSGTGGFAYGAAIDNESADQLTITGSTVSGNTGTGGDGGATSAGASSGPGGNAVGGALEANTGTLLLTSSAVTGNRAVGGSPDGSGYGGAMDLRGVSTIVDATIAGDEAVGGSFGAAEGGGIEFETLGSQRLTLASVTLAGNTGDAASGTASGGNLSLAFATSPKVTVQDTIIAGGSTGSGGTNPNCDRALSADAGHNLESTTPSQCGFSAAKDDLIGKDPLLGPLAANGASTDTLALGAGSPALAAGGQCTDPSNGGRPLSDDQRGDPRGDPCDIGAFEAQAPKSTAAPRLTGTAKAGDRLTCTPSFSGDAPLAYAYTWQRGQSNIAGATGATYKLADQDQGQQLRCTVTATNPYGSATAAGTELSIPKPPKPKVTSLKQSHSTWREGSKKATLAAAKGNHHHSNPPVGTTFTFKLNTPSTVKLTFTTSGAGRKVKHKCVKQTSSNRHDRACKLTTTAGTLTFSTGHSGTDKVAFDGRLGGRKKLKPGVYKLVITATNSTGHGSSKTLKFTIAG